MKKQEQEIVVQIPLKELYPFPNHPFQVRNDEAMQEMVKSIKEYGVMHPAIVRPREEGGYEIVAGHRRKHACELAGMKSMPAIIRNVSKDIATILMVDSNLQRETILPSERGYAFKMKMEAVKRCGRKHRKTRRRHLPEISANFRSDDEIGSSFGVSGDTVRNYISLTRLLPELLQRVDTNKIALTPAYQIAGLKEEEQALLLEMMESEQMTPSLSQAQRMRKLSQSGWLNEHTMRKIMLEKKNREKDDVSFLRGELREFFSDSFTPRQIKEYILNMLKAEKKAHERTRRG